MQFVSSSARSLWVPILLYHRVVPVLPRHDPHRACVSTARFEGHLKWLAKRGYRSVPLSDVGTLLAQGNTANVPHRAIVITFDDGYEDNYLYAWPLLKRYGFTATIFLVSNAIGSDNAFDQGQEGYEPVPMLTAEQIREMHRAGIDFGSHTCSHHDTLTVLPDSAVTHELESSRRAIEGLLDAPIDNFSYPHSKLDARVEALVELAGYRLACAGTGTRFSRFCLHRVEPPSVTGAGIEIQMKWRRLKWVVRGLQAAPPD